MIISIVMPLISDWSLAPWLWATTSAQIAISRLQQRGGFHAKNMESIPISAEPTCAGGGKNASVCSSVQAKQTFMRCKAGCISYTQGHLIPRLPGG